MEKDDMNWDAFKTKTRTSDNGEMKKQLRRCQGKDYHGNCAKTKKTFAYKSDK